MRERESQRGGERSREIDGDQGSRERMERMKGKQSDGPWRERQRAAGGDCTTTVKRYSSGALRCAWL